MLQFVHHVHYLVHDRDAMVEYLEKNFGMKPATLVIFEDKGMKDALYDVGDTQMQITEPLDAESKIGRHLANTGPGCSTLPGASTTSAGSRASSPPKATKCVAGEKMAFRKVRAAD